MSVDPYGAPSLVAMVPAFGENVLVMDNAGVVAVIVADTLTVPPDPVQASE